MKINRSLLCSLGFIIMLMTYISGINKVSPTTPINLLSALWLLGLIMILVSWTVENQAK